MDPRGGPRAGLPREESVDETPPTKGCIRHDAMIVFNIISVMDGEYNQG